MNNYCFQNYFVILKQDALIQFQYRDDDLTHAQLLKTFIGSKPEALMVTAP